MVGIAQGDQNAELTAQTRQRRQRYIDCTLKGLRPRYLQRKALEYLMEHPNATWNDFSTHLFNKDVSYQVSTSFLIDEEQNKAQMASLGQELKNLRTELKEHRVNALEGNQRPVDPNQKGRQNATRFFGYCRTNGDTPNYCRKKMRDEEIKKLQNEATAAKKVTFTQDYNKRRGPYHGSGNWTSRNDGNGAMMSTPRSFTRGTFRPSNQDPNNFRQIGSSDRGTIMIDTMTTERDHHTSHTKTNPAIGEAIITVRDRLQCHDKIHPSRILADNPDQIRLIPQYLTDLEIETRSTIYLTTRNSQLPTMATNQTWFDSLQQMMKLMNYRDYAL